MDKKYEVDVYKRQEEIGSVLKIKQLRNEKRELLEALEMYYKVLYLGEGLEALDEEEDK